MHLLERFVFCLALSPAVGRALADLLAGQPVPELDAHSPARIRDIQSAVSPSRR